VDKCKCGSYAINDDDPLHKLCEQCWREMQTQRAKRERDDARALLREIIEDHRRYRGLVAVELIERVKEVCNEV
jgi:hypothetical protein